MTEITQITIKIDDGAIMKFKGREAWTLHHLIEAGERGVTPIERPAPRWSAYVHMLRKAGLIVETIDEAHAGAFKGHHGRYVLRTKVSIIASGQHRKIAA